MSNAQLAFMMGLLGSIHCIGMCGPLALSIPSDSHRKWGFVILDKLGYQLGRTLSYCLLGAVAGLFGQQIWMVGLQQGLSIFSGAMLTLVACLTIFNFAKKSPSWLLAPFHFLFKKAAHHQANHLIFGMVNGFLPCGFVYIAITAAINTGRIGDAIFYMFCFGLGTIPLMWMTTAGLKLITPSWRNSITKWMPYLTLCLGIWFILRGLELNIPYLSPTKTSSTLLCK